MADDLDLGPILHMAPINLNDIARPLMDVAKVALGEGMEPLSEDETIAVFAALLAVVERRMRDDLQEQDARVQAARTWLHVLRQLNGERD